MKSYTHYYIFIFIFLITSCKIPYQPISHQEQLLKVSNEKESDSNNEISQFLKPYKDSLSKMMNQNIGKALGDFKKEKPGGSLGNLIVDAMFDKLVELNIPSDNVIYNYGGIRIPELKKGNITIGKIFELLPFENELVIVDVKGQQLKQWLALISENGGWPMFYRNALCLKMTNDTIVVNSFQHDSIQSRIKDEIHSALNIQDSVMYRIATNDYIANGGDQCHFLINSKKEFTGILIRDLMIDYIRKYHTIQPSSFSQITINHK
ncbi:MAG TPA: 5'-nucleotidase C-terminal domain-containing protein [Chitinophagaceae bacterium]|nr:5'-nucleotidase C-terminal domain-containing protein [Chitinophagaceae bacterium]